MDRENNHTAAREVSFIENSASVYLLQSFPEFPYKSFMFTDYANETTCIND